MDNLELLPGTFHTVVVLTSRDKTWGPVRLQQFWKANPRGVRRELRLQVKGLGDKLYTELNGYRASWELDGGDWTLVVPHDNETESYIVLAVDGRWRASR